MQDAASGPFFAYIIRLQDLCQPSAARLAGVCKLPALGCRRQGQALLAVAT